MNKKGFTLVELLSVVVIMAIIMALAFPSIQGLISSNKQKKYEAYEKSMTEYAKAYYDDTKSIIGLSSLKDKGLTGIDNECVGYVDGNNKYKSYIKCGDNYETTGFEIGKAS